MKVTTRLWTVLTVLLLFAVLVAPIQASGPVTDEPTAAPKSDNRPDPANPQGSVKNPNTGTQIRIQSISAQDSLMQIEVRPAK